MLIWGYGVAAGRTTNTITYIASNKHWPHLNGGFRFFGKHLLLTLEHFLFNKSYW